MGFRPMPPADSMAGYPQQPEAETDAWGWAEAQGSGMF